jgi:hypothetical protein
LNPRAPARMIGPLANAAIARPARECQSRRRARRVREGSDHTRRGARVQRGMDRARLGRAAVRKGSVQPPEATVAGHDIKPRTGSAVSTPPVANPEGDRNAAHARVSVARAGPPRRLRGPERRPPGPVAPHADGNRGHSPGPSASSVVGRVERRFTAGGSPSAFPGGPPLPETRPTLRGLIMDRASTIARGSDTSSGEEKRGAVPILAGPDSRGQCRATCKYPGRGPVGGAAIKSATGRARVIIGP